VLSSRYNKYKLVREAVNDRGLFTAGWFGVREKHCSGWKFMIVYDQANMLIYVWQHYESGGIGNKKPPIG